MRVPTAVRGPLLVLLGLALGVAPGGDVTAPASGVDPAHLPAAARRYLPLITDLTARQCPELPPVWVVAQVEADSGVDPTASGGGGAGLLQMDELSWVAAGGEPWPSPTPEAGDPVTDPETHLRVAVPWLCSTLRAAEGHLAATAKSASPLDAMLVCHVAGCGRVTGSASGVPRAGEAGCDERCAALVARYLDAVHDHVRRYAAAGVGPDDAPPTEPGPGVRAPVPPSSGPPGARPDPTTWTGGATGCTLPDPTGGRCLTGATRHGLDAVATAFDGWHAGPAIRSAGCWDRHSWNPRSDHPQGRACDLFATEAGRFAEGAELADGWRVARWSRGHAGPLQVKYIIWQGRYWSPQIRDQDGWGLRYSGGGIYDVRTATGGHYDHVHVSFPGVTAVRPSRTSAAAAALLAAALAVLAVAVPFVAVPVVVVLLTGPDVTGPGPSPGAVLDGPDRRALAAVPVRRGPPPLPVDPAVDLGDPAAVARAYLVAARAADADDSDRTHRRAAGYAVPGSPHAAVGVLVLDPPPPGQVRTAAVTALDLVAEDDDDLRRGYRATVATATGPPGTAAGGRPGGAVTTAYVVLARQADGHWLVTTDTADVPEGDN